MNREKKKIWFGISLITQVGITMIVPIFLCLYLGIKVSEAIGKDYFVIIFLLFGMVVSFRNAYNLTKKMYIKDKKDEAKKLKYFADMKKEREQKLKEINSKKK